jgi:hypothetical protein
MQSECKTNESEWSERILRFSFSVEAKLGEQEAKLFSLGSQEGFVPLISLRSENSRFQMRNKEPKQITAKKQSETVTEIEKLKIA